MESILEQKLLTTFKDETIAFMKNNPEHFDEAIELAIGDKDKLCWRAAWLIQNCMEKNDQRIQKHINKILDILPSKADGHKRELIKILLQMELDEDQEGTLFNICMNLWEQLDKVPSVRYIAFKFIAKTLKKYPELSEEISFITQDHFLETLSPGIRHSLSRMIQGLV